jgi:hypothetical protein
MRRLFTICLIALAIVTHVRAMPVGDFGSISNIVARSEVVAIVRITQVPSPQTMAPGYCPYGIQILTVLKGTLPKETDQLALYPIPFERTIPRPVCYLDHDFSIFSSHLVFLQKNEHPSPAFRNMNVEGSNIPISGYYSDRKVRGLAEQPVDAAVREIIRDYLLYKQDELAAIRQKTKMMLEGNEKAPNKTLENDK